MHGLESIRAINATAAAKAQDDARRAKGQKPASTLGRALRRLATRDPHTRTAPASVYAQGQQMALV